MAMGEFRQTASADSLDSIRYLASSNFRQLATAEFRSLATNKFRHLASVEMPNLQIRHLPSVEFQAPQPTPRKKDAYTLYSSPRTPAAPATRPAAGSTGRLSRRTPTWPCASSSKYTRPQRSPRLKDRELDVLDRRREITRHKLTVFFHHSISFNSAKVACISCSAFSNSAIISLTGGNFSATYSTVLYLLIERS